MKGDIQMKSIYWLLIGGGAIALAAGAYFLGRASTVAISSAPIPVQGETANKPSAPAPKPGPETDNVRLEVAMVAYSPEGCRIEPTAMGCGLYPIPVVRITNKGEPLQLLKIAVNKRYNNPDCVMTIGKTIGTGDSWMSEGNPAGTSDNPMAEYARGLRGEFVDFRRHCGDQVVFVDVATDRGTKQYEFGNR